MAASAWQRRGPARAVQAGAAVSGCRVRGGAAGSAVPGGHAGGSAPASCGQVARLTARSSAISGTLPSDVRHAGGNSIVRALDRVLTCPVLVNGGKRTASSKWDAQCRSSPRWRYVRRVPLRQALGLAGTPARAKAARRPAGGTRTAPRCSGAGQVARGERVRHGPGRPVGAEIHP